MKIFPYTPGIAEAFKVKKNKHWRIRGMQFWRVSEIWHWNQSLIFCNSVNSQPSWASIGIFYLTHQGPGRCHLSIEKETSNNRDRSSLKALSNGWTFLTQDGGKIIFFIKSCDGEWISHVMIFILCIGLARRISLPKLYHEGTVMLWIVEVLLNCTKLCVIQVWHECFTS